MARRLVGLAAALIPLGIGEMRALGIPYYLEHTFLNPTPAGGGYFGCSVAGVGGNVLVGAPFNAALTGAAYLFDGQTGALIRTFTNPTPAANDRFGWSVAGVGSNVLVGAPFDDTGAPDAGAAYLFDGGTGALLRTFPNPTPAAGDWFGWSVAGVGSNVLVGAPYDDAGAGGAHLFNGGTGALLLSFVNPTPAAPDLFGYSVAAVGSNALVGALGDNAGAPEAGAAYIFDGGTGALLRTLLNPTPAIWDRFGISVAGVGGNVLIGAYGDDTGAENAGAAYLFDVVTGALLRTFPNPAPAGGDWFGWSVAGVGGNALIGAPGDGMGASGAGAAYLLDVATGSLLATFLNPTPANSDYFGMSVAGMGDRVLVGAPYDDAIAADAGAAYQFSSELIPEPTALALLALGGLGLLARRRRIRRSFAR
ncbi:MAG: PEP-CTERM sorting domain-containing protein [Planctomycetes bacterium]|nr:PEP-CTERM sorting domain-containing protein [Planctomycetota bacterium]